MISSSLASRGLYRGLGRGVRHISVQNNAFHAHRKVDGQSHIRRYAANQSSAPSSATASSATSASEGGAAGKIFFSSLCAFTFGLGVWQTQRYFQKVEMVQKREDDLRLEPLSNFDDWRTLKNTTSTMDEAASTDEKSYRRVYLQGKFQHDKEILIGPRGPPPGALADSGPNSGRGGGGGMSSSTQGYWVVTPFVIFNGKDDTSIQPAEDLQSQNVTPKQGWFGRLWGKTNKPADSSGVKSTLNIETEQKQSATSDEQQTIVWINRGWIPRNYIDKNNEVTIPWNQTEGIVQLMAMESQTEKPGTFAPPSRLDSKNINKQTAVNKLLWLDRKAMEEMTSCSPCHPPLFVQINTNETGGALQYPVKPTQEFVGEFKVTPAVHAGYAFTWFGLSGAGMVMTRKLLRRGR